MHIAIEGIDGVGKSTAAKNLAERLGFTLVEKPLHFLFDEDGNEDNFWRIFCFKYSKFSLPLALNLCLII